MSAVGNRALERGGASRVAIVGGGLAGLATAVALADSRTQHESNGRCLTIELFESRRMLGGRATSYRDPETGELIDNCQHVSLGCCTNFDDFCRRTGIDGLFACETALNFVGPNGCPNAVRRSAWLPAPLHLAPSLLRLDYLTWRERLAVAAALRRLAGSTTCDAAPHLSMGQWLRQAGQSDRAIELFWSPVIVSALSEDVDRASCAAGRKVFVDAFLRHKQGYEMKVPTVALRTLYDEYLVRWMEQRGVKLHLGTEVRAIETTDYQASSLVFTNGDRQAFDFVCVATPWFRIGEMFDHELAKRLTFLGELKHFEQAPITSVHLWCNQKLRFRFRHAVLPGRFSQWIFDRTNRSSSPYYQVVISASREVASMSRGEVIARVCRDLQELFGEPVSDALTAAKVITEHRAVFSPTAEVDKYRPSQRTPVPKLFLAGDWTATGWPATMEGAVRSGYLAAEALLETLGSKERILKADLAAAPLARWLLGVR
ncbi:MAG: hydroxysqualene dehydroxylase HpnE [Pirellulales bacterium]